MKRFLNVRILFLSLFVFVLGLLFAINFPRTEFSTNVLDLIQGEANEIKVLKEIADGDEGKQLIARLYSTESRIKDSSVNNFKELLVSSSYIQSVEVVGIDSFNKVGKVIFDNRYAWMLPHWLDNNFSNWTDGSHLTSENLSLRIVENLDAYLNSPESFALADFIPQDPFLLINYMNPGDRIHESEQRPNEIYLWINQSYSPFSSDGQEVVFKAIEATMDTLNKEDPTLQIEYSGISLFASESEKGIRKELFIFNIGALLLVVGIIFFTVRNIISIFKIGLVLLFSLATAFVTVVVLFPQIHILALVMGSTLTGIAVDYAFHLILHQPGNLGLKSTKKAVATGAISTAIGFGLLIFAPLPFLSQVGCFVGSGLLAAYFIALTFKSTLQHRKHIDWSFYPFAKLKWLPIVLALLILPGISFMRLKDGISEIEFPLPSLKEKDQRLRSHSSFTENKSVMIVLDTSLNEALNTLNEISHKDWIHAGNWISTYERYVQSYELFNQLPDFEKTLIQTLEDRGYNSDSFAPYFAAWDSFTKNKLSKEAFENKLLELSLSLPGSTRNLIHQGNEIAWFMVLAPNEVNFPKHPNLIQLDQSKVLSQTFGEYRRVLTQFGIWGIMGMFIFVMFVWGIKSGFVSLAISSLSLLLVFGILGYFNFSITLFSLIGAILAFCISFDYSIFAVAARSEKKKVPMSLPISALTTMGVFLMLSFSKVPAISEMGIIVCLGVLITLILINAKWPFAKMIPQKQSVKRILPHGNAAILITDNYRINGDEIESEVMPLRECYLNAETLIEAMAQASAILLSTKVDQSPEGRTGMLITVKSVDMRVPKLKSEHSYKVIVTSTTNREEGMIPFRGNCLHCNELILTAEFSIFINPEGGRAK